MIFWLSQSSAIKYIEKFDSKFTILNLLEFYGLIKNKKSFISSEAKIKKKKIINAPSGDLFTMFLLGKFNYN